MTRFRSYSFGFALLALAAAANANTLRFDTDPFAGTDVLNQPGRQVVGGEPFLSVFRHSLFSFDGQAFGVGGPVRFANASANVLSTTTHRRRRRRRRARRTGR